MLRREGQISIRLRFDRLRKLHDLTVSTSTAYNRPELTRSPLSGGKSSGSVTHSTTVRRDGGWNAAAQTRTKLRHTLPAVTPHPGKTSGASPYNQPPRPRQRTLFTGSRSVGYLRPASGVYARFNPARRPHNEHETLDNDGKQPRQTTGSGHCGQYRDPRRAGCLNDHGQPNT